MIERPIHFNASMVNASRADIKTQTRRLKGLEKINASKGFGFVFDGQELMDKDEDPRTHFFEALDSEGGYSESYYDAVCPFGIAGNKLWVKENYRLHRNFDGQKASKLNLQDAGCIWYEADPFLKSENSGLLRPSIHMTRWASRMDLLIKAIRAERIQDISEDDAIAEGIVKAYAGVTGADIFAHYGAIKIDPKTGKLLVDTKFAANTAKAAFEKLWVAIDGQASWDANPWVWVISYERLKTTLPNPFNQGE